MVLLIVCSVAVSAAFVGLCLVLADEQRVDERATTRTHRGRTRSRVGQKTELAPDGQMERIGS